MKRVAALYRLSSKKQVARKRENEPDIPSQKIAIAKFLATHADWELVSQYEEAGVSAFKKSAEQREVLQQALADARAGKWSVLLIFRSDRLSRQGMGYLDVLSEFDACGVEVWSVSDNRLLSLEDEQLIIRAAEAYTANQESKKTSVRVRTRMWQIAESGGWLGGRVPFGYALKQKTDSNGNVVIRGGRVVQELVVGEYAPIVVEIFRKYVSGCGHAKIAGWLNALKIPCFRADSWSKNAVAHLLSNQIYVGLITYGRRSATEGLEPITANGSHPALISEELWRQSCEMRTARKPLSMRERSADYVLSGIAKCAKCNSGIHGRTQHFPRKSGSDRVYRWYRCNASAHRKTCNAKNILAERLEESLISQIEALREPSDLKTALELRSNGDKQMYEQALAVRKQASDELQTVDRALAKLDKVFFESDVLTPTEYQSKKSEYQERRKSLQEMVDAPLPQIQQRNVESLVQIAKDIRGLWFGSVATNEEKKAFLLAFVSAWNVTILADDDGTVTLKYE